MRTTTVFCRSRAKKTQKSWKHKIYIYIHLYPSYRCNKDSDLYFIFTYFDMKRKLPKELFALSCESRSRDGGVGVHPVIGRSLVRFPLRLNLFKDFITKRIQSYLQWRIKTNNYTMRCDSNPKPENPSPPEPTIRPAWNWWETSSSCKETLILFASCFCFEMFMMSCWVLPTRRKSKSDLFWGLDRNK